eukprot:m.231300 g.231300  ORF g.231300 m.231300 type:complete len:148 (-) comp16006_c1_seq6:1216-1659(-)
MQRGMMNFAKASDRWMEGENNTDYIAHFLHKCGDITHFGKDVLDTCLLYILSMSKSETFVLRLCDAGICLGGLVVLMQLQAFMYLQYLQFPALVSLWCGYYVVKVTTRELTGLQWDALMLEFGFVVSDDSSHVFVFFFPNCIVRHVL